MKSPARTTPTSGDNQQVGTFTYRSTRLFEAHSGAEAFRTHVESLVPVEFRRGWGLPAIHQVGLAVAEVEDAIPELEALGIGPFLVVESHPKVWIECGQTKRVRLKTATGYHHGYEIEPLGPVDGSQIFQASIDPQARPVVHHVAFRVSDVEGWTARFVGAGYPLVLRVRIGSGLFNIDATYLDTSKDLGLLVEFCSYSIFGKYFRVPPAAFHMGGWLQRLSGKRTLWLNPLSSALSRRSQRRGV